MKRLLLFFAALLMAAPVCLADEGDEVITFPVYDVGEISLDRKYTTQAFNGFAGTLHVNKSGILRVMSNTSDFPIPYADAAHTEFLEFISSFYEGSQGYVMNVAQGDVIYFFRDFCMDNSKVWFEMQTEELTFTSSPAVGGRLVPTGRAQLELLFNMPVATDGGTMTCGGQTVQLAGQSDFLYIIYEIKDIVMRWLNAGIKPGTPIEVTLKNVHASISENVKYGSDGTLRLRYVLPSMPGLLVSCNFEEREFKSYWLPDDDEGVYRMTFTKPVNTTNPGYLNLVYGNAEAGDVTSIVLPGQADGNDIVFDLRGVQRRPQDLLDSKTSYPSIMLRPGGVTDTDGDLMYSEGMGTLASWTFDVPYVYLYGDPRWEVFFDNEDQDDIYELKGGDRIVLYVYNYHLVKADGVLLTFDDGSKVTIPMSSVEVEYEGNGTTASLYVTIPGTRAEHDKVTVSFDNLRVRTGDAAPKLAETFFWNNAVATGLSGALQSAEARAYDLNGRRVRHAHQGVTINEGRKVVR